MILVVVSDAQLFIDFCGAIAIHARELTRLMPVDPLDDVLGHGVLSDLHIVGDDGRLGPQVRPLYAPADKARIPELTTLDGPLIIHGLLLGVHLFAQVARVGRLVDS